MKQFEGSNTRHGTQSGWSLHQKRGEDPCSACYDAKQKYDARWRTAGKNRQKNRLCAKAQAKAYSRIAREFPALYRRYYLEYKTQIFAEAGIEE